MERYSWGNILLPWDIFVVMSVIPSIILVPYQAAFDASVVWHWPFIYIGDLIYIISLVLMFFRSYTNRRVIPFEMLAVAGNSNDLKYVVAILRLNRILRLHRVWTFLYTQEKQLRTNTMLLMSLRFLLLGGATVHFIAAVWFTTACTNASLLKNGEAACIGKSWATHQDIDWRTASDYEKYVISLYWSVTTVTTVGYGDITPKTTFEREVAIVCMLWGVVLFGYILGELASLLTNADAQRTSYIHRLNVIKEQLYDAKVNYTLRKRVVGYYEYLWKRNKGKGVTDLLDQLPPSLQAELSLESYKVLLEKSFLWRGSPDDFLRRLSVHMKPVLYLPQQVIVDRGEFSKNMFIIQMGEAEVISSQHSPVILKEGDIFGQRNVILSGPSLKLLRARTHCSLLTISKENMTGILKHFPKVDARLRKEFRIRQLPESDRDLEAAETVPLVKQRRRIERPWKKGPLQWLTLSCTSGSKFTITWDLLVAFTTIAICWIYTHQAAFTHFDPGIGYTGSMLGEVLLGVTYIFDSVLILDILFSMKRAIVTPTESVTKPHAILMRYIMSIWFALDVLAVLPLELLSIIFVNEWKYIPLFRLNRLLKFWKVIVFFKNIEESLHISIAYVTLLKYAVYILTTTHISACIWFFSACFDKKTCLSTSWAEVHDIIEHTSAWHTYLISIYWSTATTTTVGYGDISANNTQEMVISMIIQLVGVMLYGYCLGAVAAILTNVAIPRVSFQEKMQAVHHFIRDHKMGKDLSIRVGRCLTLLWNQYSGESYPGGESLLHGIPQSVQEDVSMKRCGSLLAKVPFFEDTGTNSSSSFLRQLSVKATLYLFDPGDIIIYSGDMEREMYCVRRGYAEILSEDMFHVATQLGPGDYFGEAGFLFGNPRLYTVRATTNCQLVMVKRSDVDDLLLEFPKANNKFTCTAYDNELEVAIMNSAFEASNMAMKEPQDFSDPSIATALAVAMAIPLTLVTGVSLSEKIVACLGSFETRRKITAPAIIEECSGFLASHDENTCSNPCHTRGAKESVRRRKGQDEKDSKDDATEDDTTEDDGVKDDLLMKEDSTKEKQTYSHFTIFRTLSDHLQKLNDISNNYFLLPYTILPNTKFYYFWETLAISLVFVTAFTISIQAAFLHKDGLLWAINYALDFFFIIDMSVNMYLAYYDKGILVTCPSSCCAHYLRTKFVFDVISSFPTDVLILVIGFSSNSILRVLSLARINRLLRLYRLPLAFKLLEDQIMRVTGKIKVVEFFTYMSLGTHLTACVWFMLACASLTTGPYNPHVCEVESWALQYSHTPLSYYSFSHQYIVSLYWATSTTTTVGYGDIHAHTNMERAYASAIMVFGVVAYGYLIASVAASLVNADSARALHQSKLKAVKSYLKEYKVEKTLRKRVIKHYEYLWQRNKGVSFEELFQGMPPSLQAEVSLCLYKPAIDRVPLFDNTELGFTKLLALSIKPVFFLPGEYILRKGDMGNEMFFIHRGSVETISEEGEVVFDNLKEGDFFGEISLFFDSPRTISIRASTNCDLFALSKDDLYNALSYYPHIEEQLHIVAQKRAEIARKRSLITSLATYGGKSPSGAAWEAARLTQDCDEGRGQLSAMMRSYSIHLKRRKSIGEQSDTGRYCCCCAKRMVLFTINHGGHFGATMYWFGCLLSYYSFFTISYQAVFLDDSWILWVMNYMCEGYFLIEMYLKFHLTYEDLDGNTVRKSRDIVLHYLTGYDGFLLDCITLFPFELCALPISDPNLRTTTFLYLRVPHLARIIRVRLMFNIQQKHLNQNTVLLQILKSFFLISLMTHSVACIWYFIACRAGSCDENSWVSPTSLLGEDTSRSTHYISSYYWAVTTMTTVGYGDLSATNVLEMVFAIGIMVFGKLLFGFILGTVASTLANLQIERVVYEDKLKALKEYLKHQCVSATLRKRVFRYFENMWLRNKGKERQKFLSELPHCMQAQISLAITEPMLRTVSIFEAADEAFLRHIALTMKPCLFLPGDYIVQKGDLGYGMFFLYCGEVEFLEESAQSRREQLSEGESFGVKSLLFDMPVEYSALAVTHVDAFRLSSADFAAALKHHPKAMAQIQAETMREYGKPMTETKSEREHRRPARTETSRRARERGYGRSTELGTRREYGHPIRREYGHTDTRRGRPMEQRRTHDDIL